MKRVTGIGGVFFKSKDKKALLEWYKTHLGIPAEDWGAMFRWRTTEGSDDTGYTVWSIFADDTKYFDPSDSVFMINFRVDDLDALIPVLKEEGVTVAGEIESHENGKFAWVLDPDGRKIELWEPIHPDKDPYL